MTRRQFAALCAPALFLRPVVPAREVTLRREPNGTYAVCEVRGGVWQATLYKTPNQACAHALRYLQQDAT